ncbi:PliI/PliC-like inhibitor of I-type lysozyme [Xenorhabdus ehlersii]|uniref:PliI/PliC-like inhibitor of I-type lysozyme n=1 Tax=Xenorhabdus ehlersii TaxID=290111 RepID=A0A2D0IX21_9GAMM|nr:hypothetical protein [Xenorhabdus sp. TS4]PHM26459.1 hypothetical protein Xehl_00797 [Xenorhabdus ehlersii]RKE91705.1 PliI/PliC-like inhibitor of I-type lysozyme [Xenorhabdus ehlersii]
MRISNIMKAIVIPTLERDRSVFEDNGTPRIKFADIDGDGAKELIVSKLTAGSGNYLEVDALKISKKNVKLLTRIYINGNNDPIKSLHAVCKRGKCIDGNCQHSWPH